MARLSLVLSQKKNRHRKISQVLLGRFFAIIHEGGLAFAAGRIGDRSMVRTAFFSDSFQISVEVASICSPSRQTSF